jgi:ACS family tartrate transporter-like MFS transporter
MTPDKITADATSVGIGDATMRRVFWRVMPLLFLAMFFNYLDRINIGFASLRMNKDLALDPAVFGFGASIFFAGYMLLEVPSNLMMHRLGARIWIARILLSWGLVAALTAFVWDGNSFYAMRFLLGTAEAGFLPGLALYLTFWFPTAYRARAVGGYIIAGQIAAVVGGPVSTQIMTYGDGFLGLHGWQWMFVLEGVPAMLLGLVFLAFLIDRPELAGWLRPAERQWLSDELARERAALERDEAFKYSDILADTRVWSLAILFGCALVGLYGLLIWLPQIIKGMGDLTDIQIGWLSALPPLLGVAGQLLVSRNSDRTGDRKFHLAGVYLLAAIGLAGSALTSDPVVSYICLCVVGFAVPAGNPLFWSLNSALLTGVAGAAAIAFINTVAQFGGLIGPWMIGHVKDATGSYTLALMTLAAFLLAASIIAAFMRVTPKPRPIIVETATEAHS